LIDIQPVFFVRDPVKFPSLNRSHKRNPATNSSDSDMFWDFHINNQESIHALMFLFGDRGLPSSVRHVNAYTGNTYKFTKSDGTYRYVRVHFLTNQGIKYLSNSEGAKLAGTQPDYHILDLQDAINSGNFPSWNLCVQTIDPNEISNAPMDIFDMTKIWPHRQYPLRKVGRMVLDRNPANWFAEIEQAAFSPSNMVRGIEPSPDPMLQARMFAYPDAARYRLGINYQFLPTNAAKSEVYCPTQRDGQMNFTNNYGGDPNYTGAKIKQMSFVAQKQGAGTRVDAAVLHTLDRAEAGAPVSFASKVTDNDFEQATALWQLMGKQEGAQSRLVNNVAAHVSGVKEKWIRDEVYGMSPCSHTE
jgi:catalase